MSNENFVATEASKNWRNRPADERFESIEALQESVLNRQKKSREVTLSNKGLKVIQSGADELSIEGDIAPAVPSHWAFGQLSLNVGAPAGYLRKLPTELAANCLNHSIQAAPEKQVKLMTHGSDDVITAQAITGKDYGRIWDADVVAATKGVIDGLGGKFYPPKEWGGKTSGLFASDRDVFMFFVDGGSIVDGGGDRDQMHRGVYIWNSEVGSQTFGMASFLFRQVCGNLLVWGATDIKTLKIRHSKYAPERFAEEAVGTLKEFGSASVAPFELSIKKAKAYKMADDVNEKIDFLMKYGFTKGEAKMGLEYAEKEEGHSSNLWNTINGITAYARSFAHVDARIDIQTRAGKLLDRFTSAA